jgi:ArsR family transcriptional regulator
MDAARAFRALSDETRLRILRLLAGGPLCVGDLVSALRIPQPAASRHLGYLRRAGLIEAERRGQWAFYRRSAPRTEFQAALAKVVASSPVAAAREDRSALRALTRSGGCCPGHRGRNGAR